MLIWTHHKWHNLGSLGVSTTTVNQTMNMVPKNPVFMTLMGIHLPPALCQTIALQPFIFAPLPFIGGPPKAQAATWRWSVCCIWKQMELLSVWWWSCFAGGSAVSPGLLRVIAGPLPGHCCHLLVSCPWLRSCLEKSNSVGVAVHSAVAADLLTHGFCNLFQHLVMGTYVTALAGTHG